MSEQCKAIEGSVTGMATVYPGEDGAGNILQEAFDAGLGGLKLHTHVQCFDINGDYMDPLYECCQGNNKPIVIHDHTDRQDHRGWHDPRSHASRRRRRGPRAADSDRPRVSGAGRQRKRRD